MSVAASLLVASDDETVSQKAPRLAGASIARSVTLPRHSEEPSVVLDLRGAAADEAIDRTLAALDRAALASSPSLRIIHGKGTGALRERVAEMLRKDTRVRGFRLGAWNEGGAGVTLAEFA